MALGGLGRRRELTTVAAGWPPTATAGWRPLVQRARAPVFPLGKGRRCWRRCASRTGCAGSRARAGGVRDLLAAVPWARRFSASGLGRALRRLKVGRQRRRLRLHSPDPEYREGHPGHRHACSLASPRPARRWCSTATSSASTANRPSAPPTPPRADHGFGRAALLPQQHLLPLRRGARRRHRPTHLAGPLQDGRRQPPLPGPDPRRLPPWPISLVGQLARPPPPRLVLATADTLGIKLSGCPPAPAPRPTSTTLGIDGRQLKEGLASGKSLAGIAQERGVDATQLRAAILGAARAELDRAVRDGVIGAGDADVRYADIARWADDLLSGKVVPVRRERP
ncbi:MAG: hypothetical protein U0232_01225 [Thermomicrobiales bacterium]